MLARIFVFLLKPIALISVQNLRSGKLSLAAEPRKVGVVAISQQDNRGRAYPPAASKDDLLCVGISLNAANRTLERGFQWALMWWCERAGTLSPTTRAGAGSTA